MGLEKEARLRISADGSEAKREIKGVADAAKSLWSGIGTGPGGTAFLKEMGGNLRALATDFAQASTGVRSLNFGEAKDRAKAFESQLSSLSLKGVGSLQQLEARAKSSAVAFGTSAEEWTAAAEAYSKITYDAKGAADATDAMGAKARESGRSLQDFAPLTTTLSRSLGVAGNEMQATMGKIGDMSKALQAAGGERGFQEMIVSLGPLLENLGVRTEAARNRAMAFAGVLGRGLPKGQADQVAAQGIGALAGADPLKLIRTLGRNPYDEHGNLKKDETPDRIFGDLKRKTIARLGKKGAYAALVNEWGIKLGSEIYHKDLGEAKRVAEAEHFEVPPMLQRPSAAEEGIPFQRKQREAEKGNVELAVGSEAARNEDTYQDQFRGNRGWQTAIETTAGAIPGGQTALSVSATALNYADRAGRYLGNNPVSNAIGNGIQGANAKVDAALNQMVSYLREIAGHTKSSPEKTAQELNRSRPRGDIGKDTERRKPNQPP